MELFAALIVLNAIVAYTISSLRAVNQRIDREARTLVSLVGVIGFMFVLFIGFNSSEISQRRRLIDLRKVHACSWAIQSCPFWVIVDCATCDIAKAPGAHILENPTAIQCPWEPGAEYDRILAADVEKRRVTGLWPAFSPCA